MTRTATAINPASIRLDLKRQMAQAIMEEHKILMVEGHIDYGDGTHGTSYLNPHVLFHQPYVVWRLAQDLIDIIPPSITGSVDMVAGPVTGGAELAFTIVPLLDQHREMSAQRILHAPFHWHDSRLNTLRELCRRIFRWSDTKKLGLRRHYASLMRGKKVLIVDDVRRTGSTLKHCARLVERAGGTVVGTATLFDRLIATKHVNAPFFSLCDVPMNEAAVPASQCLQCRLKVPITKF